MDKHLLVAISRSWLRKQDGGVKRLGQHLFPIGSIGRELESVRHITLKARRADKVLIVEEIKAIRLKEDWYLKSKNLSDLVDSLRAESEYLLVFVELTPKTARCVVVPASTELFELLNLNDPPLRLDAFDLPPRSFSTVETEDIYTAVQEMVAEEDPELFSVHAEQFLNAPHILVPLFAHVMSLSSRDNIDFPLVLKTIADQLRALLTDKDSGELRIRKIERNHAQLWHDVLGDRIGFLDGGAARISGVPSSEPLALRVGIYDVCPGETDLEIRENWTLEPYVVGDLICPVDPGGPPPAEPPDSKRLYEAARYVLEPLTALKYLDSGRNLSQLFLHGPLVNQFTQYDEGEPSYLPALDPSFLSRFGISKERAEETVKGIPKGQSGEKLWNQFMSVYAVIMNRIFASETPMAGVIERSSGRSLTRGWLRRLVDRHRITDGHRRHLEDLIDQFGISDDFLFGCVLAEGEYLAPIPILKNLDTRARDKWQEVVRQYPRPYVTIIKTSSASFPFRVEMNQAAFDQSAIVLRLLYHTSRLLPKYAFPVGLDIADKYAKVPDWLSRGVSARLSADVLRRALRTGDVNLVAQIRQFLARSPRDFFYRPRV